MPLLQQIKRTRVSWLQDLVYGNSKADAYACEIFAENALPLATRKASDMRQELDSPLVVDRPKDEEVQILALSLREHYAYTKVYE